MEISNDRWLPAGHVRFTDQGRLESEVRFEPSSEWFSGHFDGYPLVPGVALLAIPARIILLRGLEQGRAIEICGCSRVRFRRMVHPNEELLVSTSELPPERRAEVEFVVTCRRDVVVQGLMKIRDSEGIGGE